MHPHHALTWALPGFYQKPGTTFREGAGLIHPLEGEDLGGRLTRDDDLQEMSCVTAQPAIGFILRVHDELAFGAVGFAEVMHLVARCRGAEAQAQLLGLPWRDLCIEQLAMDNDNRVATSWHNSLLLIS